MVHLQQYLKNTNDFQNSRHFPLLNSLFMERFTQFNPNSPDNTFKTFMKWARRSPQLIGFFGIIVADIVGDGIKFEPLDKTSGRNKIMKSENFWALNKGDDVVEEMLYDLLALGIGYNWVGKFDDIQLKEFCQIAIRETMPELKADELEFKAERMLKLIKKESTEKIAKKLRHLAASTVSINTNEYEVLEYVQRVGVNTKSFSPDEILVFKLMPFDGKIYPLPPMESLLAEVYLIWLITQNYVSFFENGGKPDNVFILPKELAGSKNHQYLIDTLQKYKKIQNKHGNLVFTGDLDIKELMKIENQMEHKELSLYLVSVLAMFYGIPVGRIPFLVGKAASGGDSGGLADTGYWRKISFWQSKIEATYNTQLWVPFFGVKMKFNRGYLQDEVRETQTEMQKTQIAEQRIRLGLWTPEKAGEYLGIDEEDIKKAQSSVSHTLQKSGMLMQNNNNQGNTLRESDAKLKAKKKQTTQNNNQTNAGGKKINP